MTIPTHREVSDKADIHGEEALNPVERFIYEEEPCEGHEIWRERLQAVVDFYEEAQNSEDF